MLIYYFFVGFTHYYWPLRPLEFVVIPMMSLLIQFLGVRAFDEETNAPGYFA